MSTFPSSEWLESATSAVATDSQFQRTSRAFDATVRFDFGERAYAVSIDETELTVHEDPTYVAWDFALQASEETWAKMFSESPPPLHNDLLGAWLRGNVSMEGDLKTAIQHIQPLKRMLAVFGEVTDE
jgi:putative sterol carrier protein